MAWVKAYLFPEGNSCPMLYANRAADGSWISLSTLKPAASAASLQDGKETRHTHTHTHTPACPFSQLANT